jgi:hypothetical protein
MTSRVEATRGGLDNTTVDTSCLLLTPAAGHVTGAAAPARLTPHGAPGATEVAVQIYTPEKSTNQLVVWHNLIDSLKRLDADWQKAQPAGPKTQASTQLPANIVVTLVQAGHTEPGP